MLTFQMVIPQWLSLEPRVRLRLKEIFNIPRSTGTTVVDGTVTCDGHTHEDLKAITQEKINAFLGEESEDFFGSLTKVLQKIVDEQEEQDSLLVEAEAEARLEEIKKQRQETLNAVHKLLEVTEVSGVVPEKRRTKKTSKEA